MAQRTSDSAQVQAQYRGGCGADSVVTPEHVPQEIPADAYVLQDGEEVPFPDDPREAVPTNQTLRATPIDEIVEYLATTILAFVNKLETNYMEELKRVTGESESMLRHDLELMRALVEPDYLTGLLHCGETDMAAYLETWQQAQGYAETVTPLGRGININAGHNVGAVIVPELWRALTKNAVLHKMPSSDQLTLRVLAETYADHSHPVAESCTIGYWPGGSDDLERSLYSLDYVMAWGNDTTIASIQQRVAPTTRFVPFHFEFGAYLVDTTTQTAYDEALLEAIAKDFSWGDQLLCFSPLVMVLEECDETERFLQDLAGALETYTDEYAMGVVPAEEEMKLTRTKKMARDYGELVSDWDSRTTVTLSAGLDRSDIAEFHSYRFVKAHTVDQLEGAIDLLGQNDHLQEFILATTDARGDALRDDIATTTAQRITAPGGAPPTRPVPWDGKNPVETLVNWTSDERPGAEQGRRSVWSRISTRLAVLLPMQKIADNDPDTHE
jgi:hypothetical protein